MIVVDKDDAVGRVARHPFPGGFESVKQRLPVGLRCLAEINGRADSGDVAATDTCRDPGHHKPPSAGLAGWGMVSGARGARPPRIIIAV